MHCILFLLYVTEPEMKQDRPVLNVNIFQAAGGTKWTEKKKKTLNVCL